MLVVKSDSFAIHPKLAWIVNTRLTTRTLHPQLFRPSLDNLLEACPDAESQNRIRAMAYLWRDWAAFEAIATAAETEREAGDGKTPATTESGEQYFADVDSESLSIAYLCCGAMLDAPEWFLDQVGLPEGTPGVAVLAEGLYWIDGMLRNDVQRAWEWQIARATRAACGAEYWRRGEAHSRGMKIAKTLLAREDKQAEAYQSLGEDYQRAWAKACRALAVLKPVRSRRVDGLDRSTPDKPDTLRLSAIAETLGDKVPHIIENHPGAFVFHDVDPHQPIPPVELYRRAVDGHLDHLSTWLSTDWPGKEIDYYSARSRGGPGSDAKGRERLANEGPAAWKASTSWDKVCKSSLAGEPLGASRLIWECAGDVVTVNYAPDAATLQREDDADRARLVHSCGPYSDLARLWMFTDRLTDVEAAARTGRSVGQLRRARETMGTFPAIIELKKKLRWRSARP